MIDSLPVLPPTSGPALAVSAGATAVAGGRDVATDTAAPPSFGATLGHFLDARDPAADRSVLSPASSKGQDPAADGKDMPAAAADDAQPAATPTPLWFPATVATPPVAAPPSTQPDTMSDAETALDASPGSSKSQTSRRQVAASAIASGAPEVLVGTAEAASLAKEADAPQRRDRRETAKDPAPDATLASFMVAPTLPASIAPVPLPTPVLPRDIGARLSASPQIGGMPTDPTFPSPPLPVVGQPVAAPAVTTGATIDPAVDRIVASAARAPNQTNTATTPIADVRADPAIVVSATPQPAGQLFAAAIATATSLRDRAGRTASRDLADSAAMLGTAPVAVREQAIVHAAADAQGSALDLSRDTGLHRMIDHIEALRDGADATDTRVRLTPDALGSVDIAVRQDGDRVHVRFTAEQEATRALIADAQPRLTDLAAARGVRIGDTSVGGGGEGGQGANGNAPTPPPRAAPQPNRASRSVATDTTITTDQRLA